MNSSDMTYKGSIGNTSLVLDNFTHTFVDLFTDGPNADILATTTPILADASTLFDVWAGDLSDNMNCGNTSDFGNGTGCTATPPIVGRTPGLAYQIVWFICWGLVLLCGIVGNTMVVLVVCRISHMRTPTNCYLVSLATADSLVLISACVPATVGLFIPYGSWIYGDVGCKLSVYLQYVAINVSSLSITAFTIERYIAICHPMRAQTICTVSRAKRIIAALWIFAVFYCMPWLFFVALQMKGMDSISGKPVFRCEYKQDRDANIYNIMYFVDLCAFYVAPSILSIVIYGLIAKILFTNNVPQNDTKDSFRHKHKLNGVTKRESRKKNQSSSSRKQVIKMLVVVVVLFLTLWAPYRLLVVYNSVAKGKRFDDPWYSAFSSWCIFLNSAINPILYNFMSVKFRRAFIRLCGCGRSFGSRPSRKNGIYIGAHSHHSPITPTVDSQTDMDPRFLRSCSSESPQL
ncbi:thyrotropin-releasing hormone receptor-like isoform X1 [Ptychodera flava]|uniref:thyrotropin-releasing hormone receptor-like isoform X1 n=1 Tax=Ptychodera flava TaxID=63121 RepID=UPI00396A2DB3